MREWRRQCAGPARRTVADQGLSVDCGFFLTVVCLCLISLAIGCKPEPQKPKEPAVPGAALTPVAVASTTMDSSSQAARESAMFNAMGPAADSGGLKVNPSRAMEYVKEVVAFGPRPLGSVNHRRLEEYILHHLKGDEVESDSFVAETPKGKFPVRNIIAKYPGTKDGIIVIAGHYDTNYPLRDSGYVGANDGGSSTAMLLEFANLLRRKRREGYGVWLVWTDGEEAVQRWSVTDSLYGSRHLASKWQNDGTLRRIKAFLLLDMIGDSDLNIERDENSTPWLEDMIYQAATKLGYQSHFFGRTTRIEDDHLPFVKLGVPSADIIDLDYGYNNVFHHTPQDTVDKLSLRSLAIVGDVTLLTLQMVDAR